MTVDGTPSVEWQWCQKSEELQRFKQLLDEINVRKHKYNFEQNARKEFPIQPSFKCQLNLFLKGYDEIPLHNLKVNHVAMDCIEGHMIFLSVYLSPRPLGVFHWGVSCKWDIYLFLIGWRIKRHVSDVVSEEKVHFSNVVTGVNGYLPCPMAGILRVYHLDSC